MADKDFKVKTGLDLPAPLPLAEGGTGQTSAENTRNALMPVQTGHSGKFITTDGTGMSWAVAPQQTATDGAAGYKVYAGNTAPTGQNTGDIWIDASTGNGIQLVRWRKTIASSGSTITGLDDNNLTLSYTAGNEQVYINGTLITRGQDYTATNGTSVVLTQSAEVGDTVEIFGNPLFSVTDTYTQAQSNSIYVSKSGFDAAGKNKIINGDFGIWQRGIIFTPTDGSFVADRWRNYFNGSGSTRQYRQQTFTPGAAPVAGYESAYFLRLNQSVAGSGGTYNEILTSLEDVRILAGQTATISFWAKAAAPTVMPSIVFRQVFGSGGGESALVNTTVTSNISLSTSWTRYAYTFLVPSISEKTLGATPNTSYVQIINNLPLNSTFTIDFWGFQIESGSVATSFQTATGTVQGELAACQRYYYTLPYNYNAERQNPYTDFLIMNTADQTSWARGVVQFPVTMRTSPTLQAPTAANYYILGSAGVLSVTSISIDNMTNASMAVVNAYRTGMSTGTTYFLRFAGNVTDYLRFSAEL
jgi:hypothetical protein